MTATYEAADTDPATPRTISPPGMVIDAVIVMNTEAPTNLNMKTAGNTNMATQAVISADKRSITLTGATENPDVDNGNGKLLIYGRRA